MEQKLDKTQNLKLRFSSFLQKNKFKIISLIILIILLLISIFVYDQIKKKRNILLSEKYIKAGLLLSNNQNEEAKNYFDEIISSENKFYSLLSFNTILERDLMNDREKILNYFEILEKKNYSQDLKDLILFKKALYFLKLNEFEIGNNILAELISKNSKLKSAAQEILK